MIEERSFENPEFAGKAKRGLAFASLSLAYVFLVTMFVTSDWDAGAQCASNTVGFTVIYYTVRFWFWKSRGLPMGHWLTGR